MVEIDCGDRASVPLAAVAWAVPGARSVYGCWYSGIEKREEIIRAKSEGRIQSDVKFTTAMKRSTLKKMPNGHLKKLMQQLQTIKARIRARVEHPFHVVKNLFKHRMDVLFALANLVIAKKHLLAPREPPVYGVG